MCNVKYVRHEKECFVFVKMKNISINLIKYFSKSHIFSFFFAIKTILYLQNKQVLLHLKQVKFV